MNPNITSLYIDIIKHRKKDIHLYIYDCEIKGYVYTSKLFTNGFEYKKEIFV